MNAMRRSYEILLAAMLIGMPAFAQQNAQQNDAAAANGNQPRMQQASSEIPRVDDLLNHLTGMLDLTADQQSAVRPILEQLHRGSMQIEQTPGLSDDERMARIRRLQGEAHKQMAPLLNADQRAKLEAHLRGAQAESPQN
jgi:small-conductance mechanosensitive channel